RAKVWRTVGPETLTRIEQMTRSMNHPTDRGQKRNQTRDAQPMRARAALVPGPDAAILAQLRCRLRIRRVPTRVHLRSVSRPVDQAQQARRRSLEKMPE